MILSARSSIRSTAMRRGRARPAGCERLEDVREVAIVAVPDIHIQPKAAPRFSPPPPCIPDPCLPRGRRRRPARGRRRWAICRRSFRTERHLSGAGGVDSTLREAARSHRALGPAVQRGARRQARRRRGARLAQPLRFQVRGFLLSLAARGRSAALAHLAHAGDSAERPCGRAVRAKRLSIRRAQGAGQRAAHLGRGCDRLRRRRRARHSQSRRDQRDPAACRAAACASLARAP